MKFSIIGEEGGVGVGGVQHYLDFVQSGQHFARKIPGKIRVKSPHLWLCHFHFFPYKIIFCSIITLVCADSSDQPTMCLIHDCQFDSFLYMELNNEVKSLNIRTSAPQYIFTLAFSTSFVRHGSALALP